MIKIRITLSLLILMGLLLWCTDINAAGIGLSINKSSVNEGETFTATISGINGKVTISSNSNISISPSGTQWVEGSMTITGTAKSSGTGTITVNPINASTTGLEPEKVTNSTSKSITIKAKENVEKETNTKENTKVETKTNTKTSTKNETVKKETKKEEIKKSNNANLSSLSANGFSITPEFNKDINKYYLSVNQEIDSIDIIYETEDSKAKVEISENENLDFGITPIRICVIAEDGTEKEYTIEVNKQDTSLGLSSLSISSESEKIDYSPEFNKNTEKYILNTKDILNLNISALAHYEDAKIDIDGNSNLKNGENIITITVKKDDEIKTYTLVVNNVITKQSLSEKFIFILERYWIVFVVAFCSIVQSGIAICFVIKYYKMSK